MLGAVFKITLTIFSDIAMVQWFHICGLVDFES